MKKNQGWIVFSLALLVIAVAFLYRSQPVQESISEAMTPDAGSAMVTPGQIETTSEEVVYHGDISGYYVRPVRENSYPGVVMIHEWWGLNDNIKEMARNLASQGYRVLAVDLYGGEVAENMQEAQSLVSLVDQEEALANMSSAKTFLKNEGATKLGSLGWCFGGGQSLQLSLDESDLSATVIYYGQLATKAAELRNIDWPVLGIFGDQDMSIPVERVRDFQGALNQNKTPNEIYIYEGVGHAFANPTGANYSQEETADAWEKTLNFLEQHLK